MAISSGTSTRWLFTHCVQIELKFGNVPFWGEGKTEVAGEKPLRARMRTNNKLNPRLTPGPRIKSGPHWWGVHKCSHPWPISAPLWLSYCLLSELRIIKYSIHKHPSPPEWAGAHCEATCILSKLQWINGYDYALGRKFSIGERCRAGKLSYSMVIWNIHCTLH